MTSKVCDEEYVKVSRNGHREESSCTLYIFLYFDFLLFLYLYVSTSRREITFDVRASGINF